MKRRLAAIMVADVVGYSSLMEVDEEGTAARIATFRKITDTEIARAEGRLFKAMGDAVLAEFASPINAVRCAVGIRNALAMAEIENEQPLTMRFGLNLADVLVEGDDLIGDGVNIAARIQQASEPGAIDVSSALFEQIRRTSPYSFEDRGNQTFRNIAEPIRIFRLNGELESHRFQIAASQPQPNKPKRSHSIAVLPLETPADDEDNSFLAEGFVEDLIFELSRFRRLFVTASSATRNLTQEQSTPQVMGDKLGVRYLLTGAIRKVGSITRLSLTLTETETGTVVWSDRLNQESNEFMGFFDDLVSRIASTVLGRIEESDIAATRRMQPESMSAYEFHLRGLEHHRLGGVTDENFREAVSWFKRAIESDPNYARPHSMLTCAWSNLPDFDLDEGIGYVERAMALDPNEPEAYRIMGSIKMFLGDFDAALPYAEKALTLSPSDAYIMAKSAGIYSGSGDAEQSLKLLSAAEELDPYLPAWCVEERLIALYLLDRFEEAVEAGRILPHQTRRSRIYRAASWVAMGEYERAKRIVQEALVASPDLNTDYIQQHEFYRDQSVKSLLIERTREAGLPD